MKPPLNSARSIAPPSAIDGVERARLDDARCGALDVLAIDHFGLEQHLGQPAPWTAGAGERLRGDLACGSGVGRRNRHARVVASGEGRHRAIGRHREIERFGIQPLPDRAVGARQLHAALPDEQGVLKGASVRARSGG